MRPKRFLEEWKWFGAVLATVITCTGGAVHWVYSERLGLKEQENAVLRARLEAGDVSEVNERLVALEKRVAPLLEASRIDPLSGRVDFGSFSAGTLLTRKMEEAEQHLQAKRYDRALDISEQMAKSYPEFAGASYIEFRAYSARGYEREALAAALDVIERTPDDTRIGDLYGYAVNALINKGEKARAEELARKALMVWPKDDQLRASFGQTFGYVPN